MVKIWSVAAGWLQGKKTILGGAVIVAAAAWGTWAGKLDIPTATAVAGFGLSVMGYADKVNRHQAELLAALTELGRLGSEDRATYAPGITNLGEGISRSAEDKK